MQIFSNEFTVRIKNIQAIFFRIVKLVDLRHFFNENLQMRL